MSYNKYFFNLKNPIKSGQVLGNFNNELNFSNNFIVLQNSQLTLTSSNTQFNLTGNLYFKNDITSSHLNTEVMSFKQDDSVKINKDGSNVNISGDLELSGNVESFNNFVSTQITGSITEIASGVPLVKGTGGINARKRSSNGRSYYEIFKGDSNLNGQYSPSSAAITVNVLNGSSNFACPARPDLSNSVLTTVGNLHTLKVHEYWQNDFSKFESLLIFCNLVNAGVNDNLLLDFRWTGAGGLGSNNHFFIGNKIKIHYLFNSAQANKVFLNFENQDNPSKFNHQIYAYDVLSNNQIETSNNVYKRIIRDKNFADGNDDFIFNGRIALTTYDSGDDKLNADFNHNTLNWDFI